MNIFKSSLISSAFFAVSLLSGNTVILSDNFSDNDRSNQNLPSSAQWFGSFSPTIDTVDLGSGNYALELTPNSGAIRHAVAYFAGPSSPISLDSTNPAIRVNFNIRATSRDPDNNFNVLRFGLLNSGAARLTTDENPDLTLVGGYGLFINSATSRIQLRSRPASDAPLFSSISSPNWSGVVGDDTPASNDEIAMLQNVTYSIEFVIERQANDDLEFTYTLSNGSDTSTQVLSLDAGGLNYDFDTFGIAWGNAFGDGWIDNVTITHVPEPGIAGLLVGFIVLAGLIYRRR